MEPKLDCFKYLRRIKFHDNIKSDIKELL